VTYARDKVETHYRFKTREQVFESGYNRVQTMAEVIESATGATLDGRRALDYGCGVGRLAVPLAQQCEHVYGIDISTATLKAASENAEREGVSNVDWLEPDALAGLSGKYDFVLTVHVLQHIRARKGEQIFRQLVRGLQVDGVGWIGVIMRPSHPVARVLRYTFRSRSDFRPRRKSGFYKPFDLQYFYMTRNSCSLNRLGRILAEEGVDNWHVRFNAGKIPRAHDAATIVFRKD